MALVGMALFVRCGTAAAQSPEIEERRHVEELSPSAKRELLRKKERFDQLSDEEKARLRRLDAEISRHPDAPEIRRVLERYGQWLASLSAKERAELDELTPEKRLARIQELRQGERTARLSKCGLTPLDANTVYQWWDELVEDDPKRLIQALDERPRQAIERMNENDPGRKFMLRWSIMPTLPRFLADLPPETIRRLTDQLSHEAEQQYVNEKSAEEKSELLAKWVRESIHFRARTPAREPDVQRMIQRLPEEERKRLEHLPREEIARMLRERWAQQMWRRMRGPGGPRRGDHADRGPRGRDRFRDDDDDGRRRDEKWDRHDERDDDRRDPRDDAREQGDRPGEPDHTHESAAPTSD
jgi:hypothetical protein